MSLEQAVEALARESGFSGVVHVDRGGETEPARAYEFADRAHEPPHTMISTTSAGAGSVTRLLDG